MKKQLPINKIVRYGILLVVAIVLPLLFTGSFSRNTMILALVYAAVGSAWNIIGGYTGQISYGNAMFFGVGAYASSVLLTKFGISPWIGMIVGGICAVLLSILIGLPCFKLQGFYFVIATIASVQILQTLFTKWDFVGGALGISLPLREESLVYLFFKGKLPYYYILLAFVILVVICVYNIQRSKLGYYLRTIKMNQEAAESLGINSTFYKMVAMGICAFITAIAGSFYAQYIMYIDPVSIITVDMSLMMALVACFGGLATVWGPVVGACILIPLAEYSRSLFGGSGSGVDMIIYAILVLVIAIYQPNGIMGMVRNLRERRAKKNVGKAA